MRKPNSIDDMVFEDRKPRNPEERKRLKRWRAAGGYWSGGTADMQSPTGHSNYARKKKRKV